MEYDKLPPPFINNEHREAWKRRKKDIAEGLYDILDNENTHHIVARAKWGSNYFKNKIRLFEQYHNAWHAVFGNADNVRKIHRVLMLESSALSDEYKKDVEWLINKWKDKDIFTNNCKK